MTDSALNGVPDFGVSHLHIDGATAQFDLSTWLEHCPDAQLEVQPAADVNSKFQSAMLSLSGKRQRRIALGGDPTINDAKQDRADDVKLYPKHIAVNWTGVTDKSGNPVPYSVENVAALFAQLPSWVFDKLRIFCMRPENFVTRSTAPDVPALAGNS